MTTPADDERRGHGTGLALPAAVAALLVLVVVLVLIGLVAVVGVRAVGGNEDTTDGGRAGVVAVPAEVDGDDAPEPVLSARQVGTGIGVAAALLALALWLVRSTDWRAPAEAATPDQVAVKPARIPWR